MEDETNDDTTTEGEDEDSDKDSDDAETGLVALTVQVIRPHVVRMLDHHGADEDGPKQDSHCERSMDKVGQYLG